MNQEASVDSELTGLLSTNSNFVESSSDQLFLFVFCFVCNKVLYINVLKIHMLFLLFTGMRKEFKKKKTKSNCANFLFHFVPFCTICYHLLPFATICYYLLPFVTICYHFVPFATSCYKLLQVATSCYKLLKFATIW